MPRYQQYLVVSGPRNHQHLLIPETQNEASNPPRVGKHRNRKPAKLRPAKTPRNPSPNPDKSPRLLGRSTERIRVVAPESDESRREALIAGTHISYVS